MFFSSILLFLVICVFSVVYLSFLYRERWNGEIAAFKLLFDEHVRRYPKSKNMIWLDAPASILWDEASAEICVICITSNPRADAADAYCAYFFDTKNWCWRKGQPPGDVELIENIIVDLLVQEDGFDPATSPLDAPEKSPTSSSCPATR